MARGAAALLLGAAALAPTACKDAGPDAVKANCEARLTWKRSLTRDCSACLAKSANDKCNLKCADKDYSGKCAEQGKAYRREPTCEGVVACVTLCRTKDDCGCEEKCYEGKDACRQAAGPLESCVTQTCAEVCK